MKAYQASTAFCLQTTVSRGHSSKREMCSQGNELVPKVRKPYTMTKQRERWTEEEHNKFLEALKLYGRAWRRFEEHIGSKTAVQIRSHAQKFFSKVVKDPQRCGAESIEIPPPRPKRKPLHPYPRKSGYSPSRDVALTAAKRSPSPTPSVLSEQGDRSPTSVLCSSPICSQQSCCTSPDSSANSSCQPGTSSTEQDNLCPQFASRDRKEDGTQSKHPPSMDIGSQEADSVMETELSTQDQGWENRRIGVNRIFSDSPRFGRIGPISMGIGWESERIGENRESCDLLRFGGIGPIRPDSANHAQDNPRAAGSLKLFGRTVLVADSQNPPPCTAGSSPEHLKTPPGSYSNDGEDAANVEVELRGGSRRQLFVIPCQEGWNPWPCGMPPMVFVAAWPANLAGVKEAGISSQPWWPSCATPYPLIPSFTEVRDVEETQKPGSSWDGSSTCESVTRRPVTQLLLI